MVWLVTVWKQKYHMSKPHLIPALPPILDKENEAKFRSNVDSPSHEMCRARAGACGLEEQQSHRGRVTTSVFLHLTGEQCSSKSASFQLKAYSLSANWGQACGRHGGR